MSILVACQCGKRFKTGDQYAGKRARCPSCGLALTVPAATAAPKPAAVVQTHAEDDLLSLSEPEVFQPSPNVAAPAKASTKTAKSSTLGYAAPPLSKSKRPVQPAGVPRISISPGIIALVILAIVIPSAIYWAKEGPMKAQAQWKEISEKAEDNLVGQITRAVQHEYKNYGVDMTDMKFQPKALNVLFDSRGMMLSLPESVSFQGSSTEGHFSGQFHPRTWRFEADVPLRTSRALLKVTGSASETDQSLEVNGNAVND